MVVTPNKAHASVLQFVTRVSSICDDMNLVETQDVPIKDGGTFLTQSLRPAADAKTQ